MDSWRDLLMLGITSCTGFWRSQIGRFEVLKPNAIFSGAARWRWGPGSLGGWIQDMACVSRSFTVSHRLRLKYTMLYFRFAGRRRDAGGVQSPAEDPSRMCGGPTLRSSSLNRALDGGCHSPDPRLDTAANCRAACV